MDSIDSLLAIHLPLSDSESSSGKTSNEDEETDTEDNVNNEDDQVDIDDDEAIIYHAEDVINSTSSSPRYNTVETVVSVVTAPQTAQTSSKLPIPLSYTTSTPAPSPSSAKTSRFVPASSTAAAAAAKGPPTPVIVTATPLGPLRPPSEYEPAASAAATRLSVQYTDSLRRRAETLMQKRLRMQRESVQKAKEMRRLTTRLAELNSRLADELVAQRRLIDDYDRLRETAQRALGVLRIVRDAETVLAETKDQLLAALAERDDRRLNQHPQPLTQPQDRPVPAADTRDDSNGREVSRDGTSLAVVTYDPLDPLEID